MPKWILKILPIIFWGVFVYVLLNVDYPTSIGKADVATLAYFFIPLLLAFIFTIRLFIKSLFASILIAVGIVLLLILKALGSLNLVTFIITLLSVIFLMGSFKKSDHGNLTSRSNLPKLKALLRRKR